MVLYADPTSDNSYEYNIDHPAHKREEYADRGKDHRQPGMTLHGGFISPTLSILSLKMKIPHETSKELSTLENRACLKTILHDDAQQNTGDDAYPGL